jgi:hypothetical protein
VQRLTVLLRHDLPDASHHYDWLVDIVGTEDAPLTTFRLPQPLHQLPAGCALAARRIADHRRVYLSYEGAIAGDRGSVQPIARGWVDGARSLDAEMDVAVHWQGFDAQHALSVQRLLLTCDADPARVPLPWTIFCISHSSRNPAQ